MQTDAVHGLAHEMAARRDNSLARHHQQTRAGAMKTPHVGGLMTHDESICLVESHLMDNKNVSPAPRSENLHTHMWQTL